MFIGFWNLDIEVSLSSCGHKFPESRLIAKLAYHDNHAAVLGRQGVLSEIQACMRANASEEEVQAKALW